MESINIRFKKLRKECGKSQEEWGKVFGITRSSVCDIESGRRSVTEKHIIMLSNWKDKRVNIDWLRTGEGDIFLPWPEEDETAAYVSSLLEEPDNPLYALIMEIMRTYTQLSPKSQEVLRDFSAKLRENLDAKKEG